MLCACQPSDLPPAPAITADAVEQVPDYRIGPLDNVQIFVWKAPELNASIPVRPDGKISTPLVEDLEAAGKTPAQLSRDLEEQLRRYVRDPVVTVIIGNFSGTYDQRIRVVGQAITPAAVPYTANMTVLDLMIAAGGLTEFAAGNRAVLIRGTAEHQERYRVRLDDLLKDGDISANVSLQPGDTVLIPLSWF